MQEPASVPAPMPRPPNRPPSRTSTTSGSDSSVATARSLGQQLGTTPSGTTTMASGINGMGGGGGGGEGMIAVEDPTRPSLNSADWEKWLATYQAAELHSTSVPPHIAAKDRSKVENTTAPASQEERYVPFLRTNRLQSVDALHDIAGSLPGAWSSRTAAAAVGSDAAASPTAPPRARKVQLEDLADGQTDPDGAVFRTMRFFNRHGFSSKEHPKISKLERAKQIAALRRHRFTVPHERPLLRRYTIHARAVFRVPFAALFLASVNHKDMLVISQAGGKAGIKAISIAKTKTICAHALTLRDEVMVVKDALEDERFNQLPSTLGVGFACANEGETFRFYASAPIRLSTPSIDPRVPEEKVLVGRLCILDKDPRIFNAEDQALLKEIALMTEEALENEFRGLLASKSKRIQSTLGFLARSLEDPNVLGKCRDKSETKDAATPLTAADHICPKRTDLVCQSMRRTLDAQCAFAVDVSALETPRIDRMRKASRTSSAYPQMPWISEDSPRYSSSDLTSPSLGTGRPYVMSPSESRTSIGTPSGEEDSPPLLKRSHTRSSGSGHSSAADHEPAYETFVDPANMPRLIACDSIDGALPQVHTQIGARELQHFVRMQLADAHTNSRHAFFGTFVRFYSARTDDTLYEESEADSNESAASADANPLGSLLPKDTAMYSTVPVYNSDRSKILIMIVLTFRELVALDDTDVLFISAIGNILAGSILRQEAAAVERAQIRFIQQVQHELRTPLHGILGVTEFLRHAISNGQVKAEAKKTGLSEQEFLLRLLEMVRLGGGTLSTLLDDVLDFGQVSGVRNALDEQPAKPATPDADVDLAALVEDIAASEFQNAEMVHRQQEAGDQRESPLPVFVIGIQEEIRESMWQVPAEKLRKAMAKIIGNALRFTPTGTVEILVAVSTTQREETRQAGEVDIELVVLDTGAGMTEAFIKDGLFKPFAKFDSFTPGAGLGMTLAASLITQMKGRLSVTSHIKEGTRVSLTIPAMRLGPSAAQHICFTKRQQRPAAVKSVYFLNFSTDQNSALRRMLARFLSSHAISEVSSIEEADLIFAEHKSFSPRSVQIQANARVVLLLNSNLHKQGQQAKLDGRPVHLMRPPFGPSTLLRLASFLTDPTPALQDVTHARDQADSSGPSSRRTSEDMSEPEVVQVIKPPADGDGSRSDNEFRVLVVEDNPINMKLLTSTLRRLGMQFEEARDGAEAVTKYISFKPSVVLLDISLPVQDGFEACVQMRKHSLQHVPRIVAITALSSASDQQRGIAECGMDEWRTKPVSPRALSADLKAWHQAWLETHTRA